MRRILWDRLLFPLAAVAFAVPGSTLAVPRPPAPPARIRPGASARSRKAARRPASSQARKRAPNNRATVPREASPGQGWLVVVREHLPETVTVYHDGREILHTLANTGVPGAQTPPGIYHVYEKLAFQIMRGQFPDGATYAVPVYHIWYFYGGDALHGYPRAAYGFPQSNGCVEIPPPLAARLFPLMPVGAEVEVFGP